MYSTLQKQIYVIAGVYRLWKCTGGDLDDLGIASIHEEYHGGRDFWFERKHFSSRVCVFEAADYGGLELNLTFGAIPHDPDVSEDRGAVMCYVRECVMDIVDNFAMALQPYSLTLWPRNQC